MVLLVILITPRRPCRLREVLLPPPLTRTLMVFIPCTFECILGAWLLGESTPSLATRVLVGPLESLLGPPLLTLVHVALAEQLRFVYTVPVVVAVIKTAAEKGLDSRDRQGKRETGYRGRGGRFVRTMSQERPRVSALRKLPSEGRLNRF